MNRPGGYYCTAEREECGAAARHSCRGRIDENQGLFLRIAIVFGVRQLLGALHGWAIFGMALGGISSRSSLGHCQGVAIPVSGLVCSFVFVPPFNMIRNERSIRVAPLLQQTHGQLLESPITRGLIAVVWTAVEAEFLTALEQSDVAEHSALI